MFLRAFRPALATMAAAVAAGCADTPALTAVPVDVPMQRAVAGAPTSYIVVFKEAVSDPASLAQSLGRANGFRPMFTYTAALKGFAAQLPDAARDALSKNPNVDYIEADGMATTSQLISRSTMLGSLYFWGLDRIDVRATQSWDRTITSQNLGEGVEVYIIDTGIRFTHQEFGGRAKPFFDAINDGLNGGDCDPNGHGTHVAGTAGGAAAGVAPKVALYSVRVFGCTGGGAWSAVIAGIDAVASRKKAAPSVPMVANLSLGGGFTSSVNTATTNLANTGVVVAVAAGNDNFNACNYSPASADGILTVGSTDSYDNRSGFSNWGTCVELFAPGDWSNSASNAGDDLYRSLAGTSMASPHVAGVAALYLAAHPSATVSVANAAIIGAATPNVLGGNIMTGSPNLLLHTQFAPFVPYTLTVTPPTNGSVSATGINCGADCSELVAYGSSVTLTATPAPGFRFTKWHDACTNTTGTCTVIMTRDRTVWAFFEPLPPIHVGNLVTSRTVARNGSWSASMNVLVHDGNEMPVGGAIVNVTWTIGNSTAVSSCTTSSSNRTLGTCTITRSSIGAAIPSVTAVINSVTRAGNSFDAARNHLLGAGALPSPTTITK